MTEEGTLFPGEKRQNPAPFQVLCKIDPWSNNPIEPCPRRVTVVDRPRELFLLATDYPTIFYASE